MTDFFRNQQFLVGEAGDMSQSIRLHKHEALCSDPQHPWKKTHMLHEPVVLELTRKRQEDPWSLSSQPSPNR